MPGAAQQDWDLGGYRVTGLLGSGGMGKVYRAVDADGLEVAIKVLHPHLSRDQDARERLRREVSALHRVRHDRVARVLDAEIDGVDAFIVTELLHGLTVDQSVAEDGPFDGATLVELAEELADALAAIHGVGVVHRDLKPSNVMLTEDGAKLIDFGIAQVGDESRVTQTGLVVGTAGYLAPEVFAGAAPTVPSVDWYAWAAVLLFAATGQQPFGAGPFQAVLARMTQGAPKTDTLPVGTAAGLTAALHPEPSLRPTPDVVIAQLRSPHQIIPEIPAVHAAETRRITREEIVAVPYQPTEYQPVADGQPHPDPYIPATPPPPTASMWNWMAYPPQLPRSAGVIGGFVLVAMALATWSAWTAGVATAAMFVLARTVGISRVGRWRLKMRHGNVSTMAIVGRTPWYFIRALAGSILPIATGLFFGFVVLAAIVGGLWLAVQIDLIDDDLRRIGRAAEMVGFALAMLTTAVMAWKWDSTPVRGKNGQALDFSGPSHMGMRRVVMGFAPSRAARSVCALVLWLIAAAIVLVAISTIGDVVPLEWMPERLRFIW